MDRALCFGRKRRRLFPADCRASCFRFDAARQCDGGVESPAMLTLILGGARSGKSRLAQKMAAECGRVTYVATARAGDDSEMAARVARHRADRPAEWRLVEEPVALAAAVEREVLEADAVLVDCLTVWLGNLFWELREWPPDRLEEAARTEIGRIAAAAQGRRVILVSNEVGCATVPEDALARAFRDAQGLVNQRAAEAAQEVIFTVAGLPMYLKTPERGGTELR